jgi:hypothetical protein
MKSLFRLQKYPQQINKSPIYYSKRMSGGKNAESWKTAALDIESTIQQPHLA